MPLLFLELYFFTNVSFQRPPPPPPPRVWIDANLEKEEEDAQYYREVKVKTVKLFVRTKASNDDAFTVHLEGGEYGPRKCTIEGNARKTSARKERASASTER